MATLLLSVGLECAAIGPRMLPGHVRSGNSAVAAAGAASGTEILLLRDPWCPRRNAPHRPAV